MKILQYALPYLAYGAIKDKKNRYTVTEYNVNDVNFIELVDTNSAVDSWSYDVPAFPDTNFFSIEGSGPSIKLRVTEELDREITGDQIEVHITSETADGKIVTDESIAVGVSDVNDNKPVFDKKTLTMTIAENAKADTIVGKLEASDADTGKFAKIVYSLAADIAEFKSRDLNQGSTFGRAFSVDKYGTVKYLGGFDDLLDAEKSSRIVLQVVAEDDIDNDVHGRTQEELVIRITDINDQAPVIDFDGVPRKISEGADIGTVVLSLSATDADIDEENNHVAFRVDNSDFAFDGNNLVVNNKLDYETRPRYVLSVTAFNPNAADPDSNTNSITVIVDVEDANDPPAFVDFDQTIVPKEGENIDNLLIGLVIATDGDTGTQSVTCSLNDPAGIFSIDETTCEVYATGILDREYDVKNTDDLEHFGPILGHSFEVTLEDDGLPPARTVQKVTVEIEDIADETILWEPNTASLCDNTNVLGLNRLFYAIQPDSGDDIVSIEVTNVEGLRIQESKKGHFFLEYSGSQDSTTELLTGLEFIQLSVQTTMGVESISLPFLICSCNEDGEFQGACHNNFAGTNVANGFPWWIIVVIVIIVTIIVVLALFVRRKPEGKLEGLQDEEALNDHDRLLSPDDPGCEQKAPLPRIVEEPTDNLGNIIRDAKQQADNEEQVPNTLLQFEYEGRNSMISNMSDLSDDDDTEQDIDLEKLPESVKRNFEASTYGSM
ncbi:Oidioi.mRNA.OKI2018_I69.PAR.g9673.t1.cds [Oikopleura dioica]|uniref:Oidioi.mRNA.OKI2018_I69.PAR.g9673.t1.cds n=1 Tax=Oikopleura dioica TaxID=34765 RepID=A0ABN7RLM2_OIKDI|nr:Oidioi.mRNA.OKI2018_I69.PAR.g9673.t1.cds [Oikopleura dioica]